MTKLQQLLLALIDRQLAASRDLDRKMITDYATRVLALVEKEAGE